MPKKNHPTLGDTLQTVYLPCRVIKLYRESKDVPEQQWDTADVILLKSVGGASIDGIFDPYDLGGYSGGMLYKNVPVFYHCSEYAQERKNGSIVGGASGFVEGDIAIVMCHIEMKKPSNIATPKSDYKNLFVIGHVGGAKKCSRNWVFVRSSIYELLPLDVPFGSYVSGSYIAKSPGSHSNEICFIWDVETQSFATCYRPGYSDGSTYSFPCSVEELKPFLDSLYFQDEELFSLDPQGVDDVRDVRPTALWRNDFSGESTGANRDPSSPNISLIDPLMQRLYDCSYYTSIDSSGILDGSFLKVDNYFNDHLSEFNGYNNASTSVVFDEIRYTCPGGGSGSVSPSDEPFFTDAQRKIDQATALKDSISSSLASLQNEKTGYLSRLNEVGLNLSRARTTLSELSYVPDLYYAQKRIVDELQAEYDGLSIAFASCESSIESLSIQLSSVISSIDQYNSMLTNYLTGSEDSFWPVSVSPDGSRVPDCVSRHFQAGYGENQIYMCAKQTYNGIIITYCTDKIQFIRTPEFPPVVAIDCPARDRLANGTAAIAGLAGGFVGQTISDISFMLAADVGLSATDNNIFSTAALKMVKEGQYHRASCPAIKPVGYMGGIGSFRLRQNPIPGDTSGYRAISALNTRFSSIDCWYRLDNWTKSLQYSSASKNVDRTMWFETYGQQWRINTLFVDTPLGSMYIQTPVIHAAVWMVFRLSLGSGISTARQEWPLKSHFIRQTKHSRNVCVQIYIVYRQGMTLFNRGANPGDEFIIQRDASGPYDCYYDVNAPFQLPRRLDGVEFYPPSTDPIAYINAESGKIHITELDISARKQYISARRVLRTPVQGESGPVRNPLANFPHEVEIMASCDLYQRMQSLNGNKNPAMMSRNASFEKAIEQLVVLLLSSFDAKEFVPFNLEAKIV